MKNKLFKLTYSTKNTLMGGHEAGNRTGIEKNYSATVVVRVEELQVKGSFKQEVAAAEARMRQLRIEAEELGRLLGVSVSMPTEPVNQVSLVRYFDRPEVEMVGEPVMKNAPDNFPQIFGKETYVLMSTSRRGSSLSPCSVPGIQRDGKYFEWFIDMNESPPFTEAQLNALGGLIPCEKWDGSMPQAHEEEKRKPESPQTMGALFATIKL